MPLLDTGEKISDICKPYSELILPHPVKCQQYYNCSMLEDRDLIDGFCYPVLHLTECIYSYLISIDTQQCQNFIDVKRGSSQKKKYYCEQLINIYILAKKVSLLLLSVFFLSEGCECLYSLRHPYFL